jgi:hypothetical protein
VLLFRVCLLNKPLGALVMVLLTRDCLLFAQD